jgi:hypothetical protein
MEVSFNPDLEAKLNRLAADRGDLIDHDDIGKLINSRYSG